MEVNFDDHAWRRRQNFYTQPTSWYNHGGHMGLDLEENPNPTPPTSFMHTELTSVAFDACQPIWTDVLVKLVHDEFLMTAMARSSFSEVSVPSPAKDIATMISSRYVVPFLPT